MDTYLEEMEKSLSEISWIEEIRRFGVVDNDRHCREGE